MDYAATNLTNLFLALADKTRLRILNLLGSHEISVLSFSKILQEPQPKISRHLAYLREAKIVETRRHGKLIYYRLKMPTNKLCVQVFREVLTQLAEDELMKKDLEQFKQTATFTTDFKQENQSNENELAQTHVSARKELDVFLL